MKNILFVAYQNASDFTMDSQGLPYIEGLSRKGMSFSLLTFETKDSVDNSIRIIRTHNLKIDWKYNIYHKRPRLLAKCLDISLGMLSIFSIIRKNKIQLVHTRAVMAAVFSFIPTRLLGAKFLFDTRGLLADKYVGGKLIKENGFIYKLIKWGENFLLSHSDSFTVETIAHAQLIRRVNPSLSSRLYVIPSCVNLDKFDYHLQTKRNFLDEHKDNNLNSEVIFSYVGKIGTWYLLSEMIDFFKIFLRYFKNSQLHFLNQDAQTEDIYNIFRSKEMELSKVKVIKPSNHNNIPKLLADSTVGIFFINPYRRYNSSPIKFGEYLAAGLPVVINSGIGDTEKITRKEKVGVIVKDFSTTGYETASMELIDLLKEKEILRNRCRATAEKYLSLNEGIEKYWQIYQKLLKI